MNSRPRLSRRAFAGGALSLLAPAEESTGPARQVRLLPGRNRIELELPASSYVTIAIEGPSDALLGVAIVGDGPQAKVARTQGPLDEDGRLPRMINLLTVEAELQTLFVDVVDHARLQVVVTPVEADLRIPKGAVRPLVGMPFPERPNYMLLSPARYVFLRIDVARSLSSALERTRVHFLVDPIGISDASQWDGRRPKSDLGEPRHISHEGGCDVDIALPASDALASNMRDHCKRVFLDPTHAGCATGTAKGVDVPRLTFLLGSLIDEAPGRVIKIFVDEVYRKEIVRAVPDLRDKLLLGEEAALALSEDGIMVHSPWHTDHVHVRFSGEKGAPLDL